MKYLHLHLHLDLYLCLYLYAHHLYIYKFIFGTCWCMAVYWALGCPLIPTYPQGPNSASFNPQRAFRTVDPGSKSHVPGTSLYPAMDFSQSPQTCDIWTPGTLQGRRAIQPFHSGPGPRCQDQGHERSLLWRPGRPLCHQLAPSQ